MTLLKDTAMKTKKLLLTFLSFTCVAAYALETKIPTQTTTWHPNTGNDEYDASVWAGTNGGGSKHAETASHTLCQFSDNWACRSTIALGDIDMALMLAPQCSYPTAGLTSEG